MGAPPLLCTYGRIMTHTPRMLPCRQLLPSLVLSLCHSLQLALEILISVPSEYEPTLTAAFNTDDESVKEKICSVALMSPPSLRPLELCAYFWCSVICIREYKQAPSANFLNYMVANIPSHRCLPMLSQASREEAYK